MCLRHQYEQGDLDIAHSRLKRNMFVDDEYQLVYCAVPKCASATFKHYLGQLHDPDFEEGWAVNMSRFYQATGIRQLAMLSEVEQRRVLNDYYTFMVVRHPLDRLYSAWHNKLSRPNASHIIQGIIQDRVTEYLKRTSPGRVEFDSREEYLNFSQYLDLVESHFHDGFKHAQWASIHDHCKPCHIKYDHVFRLETLSRDILSLYAHVHEINKTVRVPTIIHANNNAGNINKVTRLRNTFQNVSTKTLEGVMNIYRRDFDMFGYHWSADESSTCSYSDEACC